MPSAPNFVEIEHNIMMPNCELLDAESVISELSKSEMRAQKFLQWPVCWFQPCSILGSEVSSVLDNVPIVTDGSICIHQWGDLAVRHGCNTMMLFTVNKKAMQKLCSKQGFTVLSIRRAANNRLHLWDASVCHYNWLQLYLFL